MPYLNVGKENSGNIFLYYEDHGEGRPVVLIHGWPLSGASWEKQLPPLLNAGCRVITYDRRGFGRSSQPTFGYDYDTFARDLEQLLTTLDLDDVTLVGFSMGTGECVRYLGTYGSGRVRRIALLASVPPFLLETPDNPRGVAADVFDGIKQAIAKDRPAYLTTFLNNFYNADELRGLRLSDEAVQLSWVTAAQASPIGTLACVDAWLTDFRKDVASIEVPALVVHGDADRILPIAATGDRLREDLEGCRYEVLNGAPHGFIWTHGDEVNDLLLDFLGVPAEAREPTVPVTH